MLNLPNKETKVVATLGPSTNTLDKIRELVIAGVNVFRLNFSHGSHADHQQSYGYIRQVEKDLGVYIGVLADLQGPKLRLGEFKDGKAKVVKGQGFSLTLDDTVVGTNESVYLPHPEIFKVSQAGDTLLFDDGKMCMQIESCEDNVLHCRVKTNGVLSNAKGVNVIDRTLPIDALTEKDKIDLDFALSLGVDWIALSFVQKPEDMTSLKEIVKGRAKVIAKIEKPSAVECIKDIVELSDGIMVARGDLGVECPVQEVPLMQKRIIRHARRQGKPVIVATQMLESMIVSPVPTRAEVGDVANAILDGADAVMLSGETSVGEYSVEAVSMMTDIALHTEQDKYYHKLMEQTLPKSDNSDTDTLCLAVLNVANNSNAKLITTFTSTGTTALRLSRLRPFKKILALTPDIRTARWLALVWGVSAIKTRNIDNESEIVGKATRISRRGDYADNGENIIVVAGLPFGTPGRANLLQIAKVGDYEKGE